MNEKTTPAVKPPFRIHYLVLGCMALLFLGLIYAWSIFRTPLQAIFPEWTASNLSLGYTILMLCFFIGSFTTGKLSNRVHPAILLAAAAVILFAGFMVASTIRADDAAGSLLKIYIGYCCGCGLAAGAGHNMMLGMASKWFPDKQGAAAGIILTAYGLGTVVLGSLARGMMNEHGVPYAFRALAIAGLVILGFVALFQRNPGPDVVFPASRKTVTKATGALEYGPSQVLRTLPFWLYMLWSILKTIAGTLVVSNAASIAEYYGAAAVVGLIVSITNAASRFIFGNCLDRKGFRATVLLNNIVMIASGAFMLIGGLTRSIPLIVIGLLCLGAGFGSTPSISVVFFRKMWGAKNYQANYSLCTVSLMVSAFIAPNLSGYLQDHTAPGADPWISTFVALVIVCVLSVGAGILCEKKTDI